MEHLSSEMFPLLLDRKNVGDVIYSTLTEITTETPVPKINWIIEIFGKKLLIKRLVEILKRSERIFSRLIKLIHFLAEKEDTFKYLFYALNICDMISCFASSNKQRYILN